MHRTGAFKERASSAPEYVVGEFRAQLLCKQIISRMIITVTSLIFQVATTAVFRRHIRHVGFTHDEVL